MKSLYESIIGSNDAGRESVIKSRLCAAANKLHEEYCDGEAVELIDRLWKELKLDISDCRWNVVKEHGYKKLVYYPNNCNTSGAIVTIFTSKPNDIRLSVHSRKGIDNRIGDLISDEARKEAKKATKSFTDSFLKKYDAKIQKALYLSSNNIKTRNDFFINIYDVTL